MRMKKNNLAVQLLYEIVLSLVIIEPRNLGIQTVVKDISNMEKFLRKKYIGVCRWESTKVRVMMAKFPVILSIYVIIKKRKITIWSSGSSDSPRRMNSVGTVWFFNADSFLPHWEQKMYVAPIEHKKLKQDWRWSIKIFKYSWWWIIYEIQNTCSLVAILSNFFLTIYSISEYHLKLNIDLFCLKNIWPETMNSEILW